jgi:hypothetical protein
MPLVYVEGGSGNRCLQVGNFLSEIKIRKNREGTLNFLSAVVMYVEERYHIVVIIALFCVRSVFAIVTGV